MNWEKDPHSILQYLVKLEYEAFTSTCILEHEAAHLAENIKGLKNIYAGQWVREALAFPSNNSPPLTGGDEGEGDHGHPHPTSPVEGEVRMKAASFARGGYHKWR